MVSNVPVEGINIVASPQRKEQIIEQYEVEALSIGKGRGSLIVDTPEGKLLLKAYKGSNEKAAVLQEILTHMKKCDKNTEILIANKDKNYVTKDEDGTGHILKTYLPGRECDTRNRSEVMAAVKKLAQLHRHILTYEREDSQLFRVKEHEFQNELNRHN